MRREPKTGNWSNPKPIRVQVVKSDQPPAREVKVQVQGCVEMPKFVWNGLKKRSRK